MKKKRLILSALLVSVLLTAASCAGLRNHPCERDATETDRVFARTHAAYDGSYENELNEIERLFYQAYVRHFIEERSLEPFEIDISGLGYPVS